MPVTTLLPACLLILQSLVNGELADHLEAYDVLQPSDFLIQGRQVLSTILDSSRGLASSQPNVLSFKALGESFTLPITPHPIYHNADSIPHIVVEVDELSGDSVTRVERAEDKCIYRVEDTENEVFGVISLCEGETRGFLNGRMGNIQIAPLSSSADDLGVAVFRSSDINETTQWNCGLDEKEIEFQNALLGNIKERALSRTESETSSHGNFRNLQSRRFIEVVMINDHERYERYTVATFAHTMYLTALVSDLYEVFPGSSGGDQIEIQLTGVISFSNADPWQSQVQMVGSEAVVNGGTGILNLFANWVESNQGNFAGATLGSLSFDVAHLVSGRDFINDGSSNTVGLARVGVICADNLAVGTSQDLFIDARTSTVIAHEIGHNLGFKHTNAFGERGVLAPCDSENIRYVMDATGVTASQWSSCSRQYWRSTIAELGDDDCTANAASDPLNSPYCGNGVVDEGEECDCGLTDCSSVDSCCDGSTCRYTAGAICAANDACCDTDTCAFASAGVVCRAKKDASTCDIEEVCNGTSAECPFDNELTYGTSCSLDGNSDGKCYRGLCVSRSAQCQLNYNGFCDFNGDDADDVGSNNICSGESNAGLMCTQTSSCVGSLFVIVPDDGTQCTDDGDRGCYKGQCVRYSEIPTVDECLNQAVDGTETDVDCGGSDCLPCTEGKICVVDTDCFATCNQTSGTCLGLDGVDQADDLVEFLRRWIEDNPLVAGLVGAAIFIAIGYFVSGSVYAYTTRDNQQRDSFSSPRNSVNRNSARRSQRQSNRRSVRVRNSQRRSLQASRDAIPYATPIPDTGSVVTQLQRSTLPRPGLPESARRSARLSQGQSSGMGPRLSENLRNIQRMSLQVAQKGSNANTNDEIVAATGESPPPRSTLNRKPQYYDKDIEDNL